MKQALKRAAVSALALSMLTGNASAAEYTASAAGMGEVKVLLEVEDGKIVHASVDTSNETPGFGLGIADTLANQLLEAQSANIDGVAGSTITSSAVRTAAAQALAQAGLSAESKPMTPGIYIGSARGAKSTIQMAVQVDETKILNLWNLENGDSQVFSQLAIDAVVKEILEKQSLAVDTVSGATLSSQAAILAAENALRSAGADIPAWRVSAPKEKVVRETEDWDVVVVGGGTSGLTAALSAATDSEFSLADSGLRVLVVERNGFPGGDLNLSGGYVAVPSGNPLSRATGAEIPPEEFTAAMLAANPNAEGFANQALSLNVWSRGPATITGLMNRGFHLTLEDARVVPLGSRQMTAAFTQDLVTGYRNGDNWYDAMTGAPYEGATLAHAVEDAGVEIRLNTEATGLIVENNVCTGIMVEDQDSTYQINAKKVILATGYAGFDAESVDLFYPELKNVVGAQNPGNHSDAQKWVKAMGGEVVYYPDSNYIVPAYNAVLRDNYEISYLFQKGHTMWVNSQGKRFFDESSILSEGLTDIGARLRTLEDGYAYLVFGSDNTDCAQYADYLIEQNVAWSGATVEELAEKAGLPADALAASVDAYNASAASGEDSAFHTPADFMAPITGSTLYAARIAPTSTASIGATVYAADDMTITLTKDGQRIENLLAAGGACGNMVPVTGFGTHVYEALSSGTYAGECARVALTGK